MHSKPAITNTWTLSLPQIPQDSKAGVCYKPKQKYVAGKVWTHIVPNNKSGGWHLLCRPVPFLISFYLLLPGYSMHHAVSTLGWYYEYIFHIITVGCIVCLQQLYSSNMLHYSGWQGTLSPTSVALVLVVVFCLPEEAQGAKQCKQLFTVNLRGKGGENP